jgi:hypothetical protein
MEGSMIKFRLLVLVATMATRALAPSTVHASSANALDVTATRPWSAPIGHRQPRAIDIPASVSVHQQIIDPEDVNVDRKIKGVCRGC